MSDETYLDIAKRNYRWAENNYKMRSDDEADLNLVGYLLQQATELALKYHLEQHGSYNNFTHNINDLLTKTDDFPELLLVASTITDMEAKTRYVKNYRLSVKLIEEMFPIIKKCIDKVELLNSRNVRKQISVQEKYLQVFPTYDDKIDIPVGWEDTSEKKDLVPSISLRAENGNVAKLLIDYKSQALRHPPRSSRYVLFINEKFVKAGNDFEMMLDEAYDRIE